MIRTAAVAGQFYPADRETLAKQVDAYLSDAGDSDISSRAIIAPHAGYIYSASVAAMAYACIIPIADQIRRVVLLGPSHHVYVPGIAICDAEAYATPLGTVPIDTVAQQRISHLPQVVLLNKAHCNEHSLEVHLPFLQRILGSFSLVPLVVGDCPAALVSEVLDLFCDDPHCLIVVSSDLSHFHDYETANEIDAHTSQLIEQLNYDDLKSEQACGCRPVSGLLYNANKRRLRIVTLDQRNSGDTAGSKLRVVGYGAYAIPEPANTI